MRKQSNPGRLVREELGEESAGSTEQELQTIEGNQVGLNRLARRRCSLKGMEVGTRQQCAPECVQSPALGLTSRLKPEPYFPQTRS